MTSPPSRRALRAWRWQCRPPHTSECRASQALGKGADGWVWVWVCQASCGAESSRAQYQGPAIHLASRSRRGRWAGSTPPCGRCFGQLPKRGNEDKKTCVDIKLHDLGQEGPFLEHHVQRQEGGASLAEAQRTQGGEGEAVELIATVPKRAETEQPCSSLCTQSRDPVRAAIDPQELSAMVVRKGRGGRCAGWT